MAVDWDALVIGPTVAEFGIAATYRSQSASFPITGVFDEAYLELTPFGRGGLIDAEGFNLGAPGSITTEMPVLGVQLSQFPAPPEQADTLFIPPCLANPGGTYVVKEIRSDGHGWAKLLLNLLAAP
jgi:hypothetical protein